jgi:hypothetical protein
MQIELCIGEMQRRLDLLGTVDVMLTFRRPVDAGRAEQLVRAAWDLTWLNPGLASGAQIDSGTALARVAAGSGSYYVYSVSGHLWIGDMAEANTEAAAA